MQSVYVNVDDIDPFTGGLAEDSVPDGLVGKTFSCIIGQQFEVLKNGDRFFFTHNTHGEKSEKGLPQETKSAIRNRRLSDIICDNTETESNPVLVMKQGQQNETCFSRPVSPHMADRHISETLYVCFIIVKSDIWPPLFIFPRSDKK